MNDIWMITNQASGSHDPVLADRIAERLDVGRRIVLPDDGLPGAAEAATARRIVILTGDGTVSGAVAKLDGWNGELVVLPGGTMNLLSKKLHGDADVDRVAERIVAGRFHARHLPTIEGGGVTSLVGIIAGPTTTWGDVREDLRHFDLRALAESVPIAFNATLGGHCVSLEGDDREFQAIFIDAEEDALVALGVSAANAAELAQHGLAWLAGDFLGGPCVELGRGEAFTVTGLRKIGLLVDGERSEAEGPCRFSLGHCGLRFLATGGSIRD